LDVANPLPAAAMWCAEFELSADHRLHGVVSRHDDQQTSRVLVRLHGEPLGYVRVARAGNDDEVKAVLDAVNAELLDRLNQHLLDEGQQPMPAVTTDVRPPAAAATCPNAPEPIGLFSVVVCTRDRADILGSCLNRLAALTYPDLEFIVVDNAPSDDSTELLVKEFASADERFRYVREPVPGLSSARNRGLAAATGSRVAYTDDDVSVDPGWIDGLARGFRRRADVACVTGLVCTANITNPSEAYFDARTASWSSRCESELFDLRDLGSRDVLYPYAAGIFGTGASFAVNRDVMRDLGGFDEALGAGTKTRGGEDLDMFVRLLRARHALAYEATAVVWHHHRADEQALLKQMYGYGTGLSAFLTKLALSRATRWDLLHRVPGGIRKLRSMSGETQERLVEKMPAPPGIVKQERLGFLAGPYLYAQARRAANRRPASGASS